MNSPNRIAVCSRVSNFFKAIALLSWLTMAGSVAAATAFWSAGGGSANTNWSLGANWTGGSGTAGVPGSTDDVIFGNPGAGTSTTAISNAVDNTSGNFLGTIGSLSFTNNTTATYQNMLISPGVTLNVTNNTGPFGSALFVGTPTAAAANVSIFANIYGPGGTLNVNNTNATISLSQSGGSSALATLLMTNLDNFSANIKNIAIGDMLFGIGTVAAQGSLFLAKTNVITTAWVGSHADPYSTANQPTNAIQLGVGSSATLGGINALFLGLTNAIYTDSIGVGGVKSGGSAAAPCRIAFAPGFTNSSPSAYFRGAAGNGSRIFVWGVGDTAINSASSAQAFGSVDLSFGTVDALIESLILGRDRNGTAALDAGVFTFSAGKVDVNTLIAGDQGSATTGSACSGTMNVNGTATLAVNTLLELGHTTVATAIANNTRGILNITGGTVLAGKVAVGAASTTNNIVLNSGTLIVSNTLATNSAGLFIFATTNSIIGLTVTANASRLALVQTLNAGGATNVIRLDAAPVIFSAYPTQFALIKYTTLPTFNIGLTNLPAWAPGATLVNNTGNKSIDLLLPSDPRPVITAQPSSYSGNPGDNVAFNVTVSGTSVAPLSYQWYLGAAPLANGATGNGSTISGATTASLALTSAQAADNGNYTVVVSNIYGTATSAPPAVLTISAGSIAPSLTGPNNLTVIQGNNAAFSATVAGNPAPALQWRRNGVDILGQTASSYTVTNAQYATDNGVVFSIVATNVAGSATNNATLTVIVPPVITAPPVSLVVTSTQAAAFSVMATGVPTPTYQWFFNNVPISNETNSTYNIASASAANIGTYKVNVANAAGATNSVNVTLTVNSLMSATAFSPSNGATALCYDTPLAVTFSTAPSLGAAGLIKIYNVTNSTTPVDTINVASGAVQQRSFPNDGQSFTYQTIVISGSTAKIYPHFSVLTSNQTYYVTIDAAAFTDASGAYYTGITATNVWQFSTKAGGPVDPTNPIVNLDGSADFLTVQGAVNSLATGTNATQRVINIRNGRYNEIVDIAGKHNVTLRGQSRAGAVLYFPNNANFQTANGGTTHARMTFKVNANDLVLDTLTVSNSTPQGGSQAEALMVESSAKRGMVLNCEIDSRQDTILGNQNSSQTYFYKTIIRGNFDYVWGGGNFYFDQCEIRTVTGTANANFSAARTDTSATTSTNFPWLNPGGTYTANGMSFVNCTFTAESGVGPVTLAGSNGTSGNNVSWFGCDFATNYIAPSAGLFSGNYVFWQSANTSNGVPVTYPVLITISGADARLLAATNIPVWFYGWMPQLAPNILTNPVSQTVNYAASATFTVVATGVPAPTYQWQHAGTNLPSATSSTLTIMSATANNAGAYAVIVTTTAGSVTSSTATLTVNPPPNTAPTFTAPITGTNFTINVGVSLAVSCPATDSDSPAQMLTYSLLTGPSGAAVNSGNGNFTWRPTVPQSNSVNNVSVVVTDNGTPNLSATNSFTVTVNPLTAPVTGSTAYTAGQFSTSFSGQIGPDYALQANTNLASGTWTTVATTNSPATMPVILTDPNAGLQPVQFYRIVTGPPLP